MFRNCIKIIAFVCFTLSLVGSVRPVHDSSSRQDSVWGMVAGVADSQILVENETKDSSLASHLAKIMIIIMSIQRTKGEYSENAWTFDFLVWFGDLTVKFKSFWTPGSVSNSKN